jgi:hypothetical protein
VQQGTEDKAESAAGPVQPAAGSHRARSRGSPPPSACPGPPTRPPQDPHGRGRRAVAGPVHAHLLDARAREVWCDGDQHQGKASMQRVPVPARSALVGEPSRTARPGRPRPARCPRAFVRRPRRPRPRRPRHRTPTRCASSSTSDVDTVGLEQGVEGLPASLICLMPSSRAEPVVWPFAVDVRLRLSTFCAAPPNPLPRTAPSGSASRAAGGAGPGRLVAGRPRPRPRSTPQLRHIGRRTSYSPAA